MKNKLQRKQKYFKFEIKENKAIIFIILFLLILVFRCRWLYKNEYVGQLMNKAQDGFCCDCDDDDKNGNVANSRILALIKFYFKTLNIFNNSLFIINFLDLNNYILNFYIIFTILYIINTIYLFLNLYSIFII